MTAKTRFKQRCAAIRGSLSANCPRSPCKLGFPEAVFCISVQAPAAAEQPVTNGSERADDARDFRGRPIAVLEAVEVITPKSPLGNYDGGVPAAARANILRTSLRITET